MERNTTQPNPLNTHELIKDFKELLKPATDDKVEYMLTRLYVGIRLNKIMDKADVSIYTYNMICDTLHNAYVKDNYSLDKMIDAVYNYINYNTVAPTFFILKDIQAFLEDYCEECI